MSGPRKHDLYQVAVEQADGLPLMVGPAMRQESANAFAAAIAETIKSGDEKQWSNPTVMNVTLPERLN